MPDIFRNILLAFVRVHLLHHAEEGSIYGLEMMQELARHGYTLSPGTLYPIFHSLETAGYLYPWYRKLPPTGADLSFYPQALLKANPLLKEWHFFGMEWKEHVAWFAPIAATAVATIVWRYGALLASDARLRRGVIAMFSVAFAAAAVAGGLGALITKAAPVR